MELTQYLQFALALIFVLALIWGLAAAARRFGLTPRVTGPRGGQRRLSIVEVLTVDAKRRLLLVRRDDVEHLILLGGSVDLIVESSIPHPGGATSSGSTEIQQAPLKTAQPPL